jgi:hypothetical protein
MDRPSDQDTQAGLVPAELVVDAIRATHRRWMAAGDVKPFLFNFVDYLTVALPRSTDVAVVDVETEARCSTATDPRDWAQSIHTYGEAVSFRDTPVQFRFRNRHVSVTEITERGRSFLASLTDLLGHDDAQSGKDICDTLVRALRKAFRSHPTASDCEDRACQTDGECLDDRRRNCPEAAIHTIVEGTARNLAAAISPGDDAYRFAIHSRACQHEITVIQYTRDEKTKEAIPELLDLDPRWREYVQEALQTGFLRFARLSNGRSLLCIPCHFGGVPWIIFCREFEEQRRAHWIAYTLYRDMNSRLSGAIRLLGQYSLAREMARLFRQTLSDDRGDGQTFQEATRQAWGNLPCVYPVPQPFLEPCPLDEKHGKLTLRLGPDQANSAWVLSGRGWKTRKPPAFCGVS